MTSAGFWESHCRQLSTDWGVHPNEALVQVLVDVRLAEPAGGSLSVLDLGAGHGGDAV